MLRRRIILRPLGRFLREDHVDSLSEQQAVRAASEMERANLLARRDLLPFGHGDLVRRALAHADRDKAHETDVAVVGFDENDRPRGHLRYVGLRVVGRDGVGPALALRVGEAFEVVG